MPVLYMESSFIAKETFKKPFVTKKIILINDNSHKLQI